MKSMPAIPETQKSVRMTNYFAGYNHKEVIADGEMYNTLNLSDDQYPVLTLRKRRGITSYDDEGQDPVPLTGIHGRDKLVYIRGTEVFYNFTKVTGVTVSAEASMLPKKIVSMGAYVCIWPDKVYFNTVDQTDCGSMERNFSAAGNILSLHLCRADGTNYDMTQITVSVIAPANPTNGQLWIDQSGAQDVLRQYSSSTQEWVEVPTVYVKIGGLNVGKSLNEYDAVEISGLTAPDAQTQHIKDQVSALNGSYIVYGAGNDYIIIAGILSASLDALKNTTVEIGRTVPNLDYIVESNNRLWGCKYGNESGKVVNEIRACKLGDFRNWSCFMGLSTDSYTASIGTDGEFTGAIAQRGYPVFFKENCIHKVSGIAPSSFQITTTNCRGVQRGSWRSVEIVNETVYYKSRHDVMAYDGNMPQSVSDALGSVTYSDARAGSKGDKYYISMKNANDEWSLFTYNTKYGDWYREDNLRALEFGTAEDELYAIDEEHNTLIAISGSRGTLEEELDWLAEFGLSGIETGQSLHGSHYLSRFDIRMYLEDGGKAELEIMYDSNGEWTKQGEIRGNRMRTFVLPVIPRRCDHLRFRMKGKGEFRIYSIARYMEVGSDA